MLVKKIKINKGW